MVLHAVLWARGKKPGLYSMADVLGLKISKGRGHPRVKETIMTAVTKARDGSVALRKAQMLAEDDASRHRDDMARKEREEERGGR